MKLTGILTILFGLSLSINVKAHSPTEIGFKFIQENEKTFLEVHMTSITLFDLLGEEVPSLKNSSSLDLTKYLDVYTEYFNRNLLIDINSSDQVLTYYSSYLMGHDTHIRFELKDVSERINSYAFQINAFKHYQAPKFTVFFDVPKLYDMHQLSKDHNRCYGTSQHNVDAKIESGIDGVWYLLILPLLGFFIWVNHGRNYDTAKTKA